MRYRSLIVFRLGGWSPLLPTGFHVSRGTLVPATYCRLPLQDCHPLWQRFPTSSGQLSSDLASPQPQPSVDHWFGLFPFRSPLLRKSIFLSFPPVTKMFQFAGLLSSRLFDSSCDTSALPLVGSPIRKSPDHSLLTTTRSISLFVTSFISF